MIEHIENLKELGIDGLMTGWSLGGYPGGALALCNSACVIDKFDDKKWYKETYSGDAVIIKQAVEIFSDAFREFPFSVDSLYFGGQNLGPGNLWSLEKRNRASTMVCFTFDDYKSWVMPYGLDGYLNQMKRLTDKWSNGLKILKNVTGKAASEFISCAKACYCHFISAYNLTAFNKFKEDYNKNSKILIELLNSEEEVTRMLISIISNDAKIGFEMTNHYYYNENLLLEKLINISELKEKLLFC